MFSFIKNKLKQAFSLFDSVRSLFTRTRLNEQELKELEIVLIKSDVGVKTVRAILAAVRNQTSEMPIREIIAHEFKKTLVPQPLSDARIYLLVGINGSGKTSMAGKLAHRLKQEHKKVLMVAADTFRAAAVDQLQVWAARAGADIVMGAAAEDPASVVYKGCTEFKAGMYDAMIIDTAGRLQTKIPLMKELEKIKRSIAKQLPEEKIETVLVIDSMLGQNSLEQARLFNEATPLDAVAITKMDGTGKGGIVFAISAELGIPIAYISGGEQIDDLTLFNADEFVQQLME